MQMKTLARKKFWLLAVLAVVLVVGGTWKWSQPEASNEALQAVLPATAAKIDQPIQPIPTQLDLDPAKVELGDRLFHDPQLSSDNTVSCATCHNLKKGGTDRLPVSLGMKNEAGQLNSPTVFNSGFNSSQFWDGRADTLEDQIEGPIQAEAEMASSWPDIVSKLKRSPDYVAQFQAIYRDGVNPENIKNAIATFERSLITPNSRFDRFLKGNLAAITIEEKEGYERFKAYGCIACHQGVNVGGNMFHSLGLFGDYFEDRGNITKADYGRYNVTGEERDRYVFKVPSLRNVMLTSPYFHDGAVKTLAEAIQLMGKYQLGRELSEEDTDLILQFLVSLTGEYQGKSL